VDAASRSAIAVGSDGTSDGAYSFLFSSFKT
jgi:hypothetical protein